MSHLNHNTETNLQHIKKINNQNSYIQMSNLVSGSAGSSFLNNSNRSSFRLYAKNSPVNNASDLSTFSKTSSLTKTAPPFGTLDDVGFIDDLVPTTQTSTLVKDLNKVDSSNNNAVYNFPWDFKLKPDGLFQTSQLAPCSTRDITVNNCVSTSIPPPLPSMPPPQTLRLLEKSEKTSEVEILHSTNSLDIKSDLDNQIQDESQYCAPWDLKLQEEMLKMMTQKQQNNSNSIIKPAIESEKNDSEFNLIQNTKDLILLPNDGKNNTKDSIQSENSVSEKSIQSDEYSLPWEHKQSLLLQNLVSGSSFKQSNLSQSTNSTLTQNSTNISNRQNLTVSQAINQSKLSPRASNSSSSSTHSSTSSLSTNSHTSLPSLPLPPTMPPPPPPPILSLPLSNSLLTSVSSQFNQLQQSPRLTQKQSTQNQTNSGNLNSNLISSAQINGFTVLSNTNTNTNTLNKNSTLAQMNNTSVGLLSQNLPILVSNKNLQSCNSSLDHNYLNEKNKFSSWGSNPTTNTNSTDPLICNSADDSKKLFRQHSARSSNHQFMFSQNFQTGPSQLIPSDIQVAVPVTALVFSQTSSLPCGILPLNLQSQQQNIASPSHMSSLERQTWYHGNITRKQAESVLNNKSIGSFLVRQSESGNVNDFSLSLVSGSGCVHMRICLKNGEFILGQCSQPFPSILKMIEHYRKVEVPIKGAQHVKLKTPISCPQMNEYS